MLFLLDKVKLSYTRIIYLMTEKLSFFISSFSCPIRENRFNYMIKSVDYSSRFIGAL